MTRVITQRSAENMADVRRLLRDKQPGFSAALESALRLAELELTSPETPDPRNAEAVAAITHLLHPTAFGLPPDGA